MVLCRSCKLSLLTAAHSFLYASCSPARMYPINFKWCFSAPSNCSIRFSSGRVSKPLRSPCAWTLCRSASQDILYSFGKICAVNESSSNGSAVNRKQKQRHTIHIVHFQYWPDRLATPSAAPAVLAWYSHDSTNQKERSVAMAQRMKKGDQ